VIWVRRRLLVMPVTAHKVTRRASARAWTRESPKARSYSPPPVRKRRVLDIRASYCNDTQRPN
jgi:hypothetical protein